MLSKYHCFVGREKISIRKRNIVFGQIPYGDEDTPYLHSVEDVHAVEGRLLLVQYGPEVGGPVPHLIIVVHLTPATKGQRVNKQRTRLTSLTINIKKKASTM